MVRFGTRYTVFERGRAASRGEEKWDSRGERIFAGLRAAWVAEVPCLAEPGPMTPIYETI